MEEGLEDAEARFDRAMRDPTLTPAERETAALIFFRRVYADEQAALDTLRAWREDRDTRMAREPKRGFQIGR